MAHSESANLLLYSLVYTSLIIIFTIILSSLNYIIELSQSICEFVYQFYTRYIQSKSILPYCTILGCSSSQIFLVEADRSHPSFGHCTELYCSVLRCTELHCSVLDCTVPYTSVCSPLLYMEHWMEEICLSDP